MQRNVHANGVVTYTFDSLAGLPLPPTSAPGTAASALRRGILSTSACPGATRAKMSPRTAFAWRWPLGIDGEQITYCQQVHGTGIAMVDFSDAGQMQSGCDGMITDTVGLPLMLVFADCTPLLLYDRERHVLGICHAGWRGTVNGAAEAMVWAMQAAFNSEPADLLAYIGPSIGPESYEVGDEVLAMATAKLSQPGATLHLPQRAGAKSLFQSVGGQPDPISGCRRSV